MQMVVLNMIREATYDTFAGVQFRDLLKRAEGIKLIQHIVSQYDAHILGLTRFLDTDLEAVNKSCPHISLLRLKLISHNLSLKGLREVLELPAHQTWVELGIQNLGEMIMNAEKGRQPAVLTLNKSLNDSPFVLGLVAHLHEQIMFASFQGKTNTEWVKDEIVVPLEESVAFNALLDVGKVFPRVDPLLYNLMRANPPQGTGWISSDKWREMNLSAPVDLSDS